MIIPNLTGTLQHNSFFIYGACDEHYFDEFGKTLINSLLKNSNNNIHLHLFNPRADQIAYCMSKGISYSHEQAPLSLFEDAAKYWSQPLNDFDTLRLTRIRKSMEKGGDKTIVERLQKTYFACARFIRLQQLLTHPTPVLSIDVDAVVRKNIPILSDTPDLYIHKNSQFLAGGIYLTGKSNFLDEYTKVLIKHIENDYLYWSLDQDVLDTVVPNYNYQELPKAYIDWFMQPESFIWTAKGKRKDMPIFKNEQKKYSS